MAATLQSRQLKLTIKLAAGSFNKDGDPDTVTFGAGYRIVCDIDAPGGEEYAVARISLFGASQDAMNRLTVINWQNLDFLRNVITIEATDSSGNFSAIFQGEIYEAQPDYDGAPDVPLVMEARSGLIASLTPAQAQAFAGTQPVATIMGVLAKELGATLENNGVTGSITDEYLPGSPLQKVRKLARHAGIQAWYMPESGLLSIAPMGSPRTGNAVTVDAAHGLVGWPKRMHVGVNFTRLFDPNMAHGMKIKIASTVEPCNGEWYIIGMSHRLAANMPGGPWFTHFTSAGYKVVVLQ